MTQIQVVPQSLRGGGRRVVSPRLIIGAIAAVMSAGTILWLAGVYSLLNSAGREEAEAVIVARNVVGGGGDGGRGVREGGGGRPFAAAAAAAVAPGGGEIGDEEEEDVAPHDVTLELLLDPPVSVGMRLFNEEAPDASRFVREVAARAAAAAASSAGGGGDGDGGNGGGGCAGCNLYRAEPVPDFWGDESLPDTYFGGRWGPPYALLQGQLAARGGGGGGSGEGRLGAPPAGVIGIAKAEDHRPVVRRGHVAWAGGKGGPHFFVALADHPEWGNGHTVWAEVLPGDMAKLDHLVKSRELKTIKPKRPPVLSYFVEPVPFSVIDHAASVLRRSGR